MRFTITKLALIAAMLLAAARAYAQINPGNQILWPGSCTTGLVYEPFSNTCVAAGGSGTVDSGAAGDLAYYGSTGTTVSQLGIGAGLQIMSGSLTTTGVAQPTQLSATFAGVPANSQVVLYIPDAAFGMTVASSCAGSYGRAATAATASAAFTVVDVTSSTTLCTATFAASGTTASFSGSGGTISQGDLIEIIGPATADATLATIGFSIYATHPGGGGGPGTNVAVNGGSTLANQNLNSTTPAAGGGHQNLTIQVDGSGNTTVEAPLGSSSAFGMIKCGTGLSCTSGVASVPGGGSALVNIGGSVTWGGCTFGSSQCVVGTPGATFTISSIPGTYNSILIDIDGQTSSGSDQVFACDFNGDTASHYKWNYFLSNSAANSQGGSNSDTAIHAGTLASSSGTSQSSQYELKVLNYAGTTFYKSMSSVPANYNNAGNPAIQIFDGVWSETTAVTSISCTLGGGNFVAGTTLSIYGLQ